MALVASVVLGSLAGGFSLVAAQSSTDPSNVVLVFDVSNSILLSDDGTNVQFAAALEGIADRVDAVAGDLAIGNAEVSFVVFGRTAVPYPSNCARLKLHEDPAAIARFEACLRSIAGEYRAGANAPVRDRLNTQDTDHVAALREAADLLPATSDRSAVVFFTDGEHDPRGTARDNENVVSKVRPAFAGQSPLAILPVGLGSGAGAFETELRAIYDGFLRDMEPCEGRPSFAWPQVVFQSADNAGAAVALALQEVTCSFTVAPTPIPTEPPTAPPTPTPTLPPSPTRTPEPTSAPVIVPVPTCTGGLLDCNPWIVWVLGGLVLIGLLGGGGYAARQYARQNRAWITAQVDGGENRALGWGPELGVQLEQDDAGWFASPRPVDGAEITVRYEGENRFVVVTGHRPANVHQGDPTRVRAPDRSIHELILRRYRDRPAEGAVGQLPAVAAKTAPEPSATAPEPSATAPEPSATAPAAAPEDDS